jgi:iron only hydrogenase large subunit-like protein
MNRTFHSVRLDKQRCTGCTHCMRECPTEAIRVRKGKASIINERCIDCGECIRVCPYHAKRAVTDPFMIKDAFEYTIALPSPEFYGQFEDLDRIEPLLEGLKDLGFDAVYEVAYGADIVSALVKQEMDKNPNKPLICSVCPVIVRLIQTRFPGLIDHIVPVDPPAEVAAIMAKRDFAKKRGVKPSQVGAFFITPCSAKITNVRNPIGREKSAINGVFSILEIYGMLSKRQRNPDAVYEDGPRGTRHGVGWSIIGGVNSAIDCKNAVSVDGIRNVLAVLEELEDGNLSDVDFFEGWACDGGCVGGPLNFANGYVAQTRIRKLMESMDDAPLDCERLLLDLEDYDPHRDIPILEQVNKLDDDFTQALLKMERIDKITASLPGLDCGSCGSPTCRSLAEDVVQGQGSEMDCIFRLRATVGRYTREMQDMEDGRKRP